MNSPSRQYEQQINFAFIHINKTGGSSIEKALDIPFEHLTALEKIRSVGYENWKNLITFSVVRNPWDKVVSHYLYRLKRNVTDLRDNPIGFNQWVRLTYDEQDAFYYKNPKMFMPQIDWIADEQGHILVDHILRFETLERDFNRVLEILDRNSTLPHLKKSVREDYHEYYDEDTIDIVGEWFKEDIGIFGYEY